MESTNTWIISLMTSSIEVGGALRHLLRDGVLVVLVEVVHPEKPVEPDCKRKKDMKSYKKLI